MKKMDELYVQSAEFVVKPTVGSVRRVDLRVALLIASMFPTNDRWCRLLSATSGWTDVEMLCVVVSFCDKPR